MILAKVWLDRESLREQLKDCSAAFDRQQEMLDRNAEQIAALRKDAERYRWLRENVNNYELRDERDLLLPMDELDAAIDAAMKEEGK